MLTESLDKVNFYRITLYKDCSGTLVLLGGDLSD